MFKSPNYITKLTLSILSKTSKEKISLLYMGAPFIFILFCFLVLVVIVEQKKIICKNFK